MLYISSNWLCKQTQIASFQFPLEGACVEAMGGVSKVELNRQPQK